MSRFKDEAGKRYGRLVVIKPTIVEPRRRKQRWLCQCDCGNTVERCGADLRNGDTTSCGCYRKEFLKTRRYVPVGLKGGAAAFNRMYKRYKTMDEVRHQEFGLTKEEFRTLTQQPCAYCGEEPNHLYGKSSRPPKKYIELYKSNGLDRIDSSKGHTIDNCVPCCFRCNRMKSDLSKEQFLTHIRKIINYYGGSHA
jgi:hypothetical protein